MSKLLPCFTGMTCLTWVFVWTMLLSAQRPPEKSAATAGPVSLSLSYDSLNYLFPAPYVFDFSASMPIISKDSRSVLRQIAALFSRKNNVNLKLTGLYSLSEKNMASSANLGLARAESVKILLAENGCPVSRITTAALPVSSFTLTNGQITGGVLISFESENLLTSKPETINLPASDEGHSFFFAAGKFELSNENLVVLEGFKQKLQSDRRKKLNITGYSETEEEERTSLNLAEMRARMVRRYLVDNGVHRSQIELSAKPGMARTPNEQMATMQYITD